MLNQKEYPFRSISQNVGYIYYIQGRSLAERYGNKRALMESGIGPDVPDCLDTEFKFVHGANTGSEGGLVFTVGSRRESVR